MTDGTGTAEPEAPELDTDIESSGTVAAPQSPAAPTPDIPSEPMSNPDKVVPPAASPDINQWLKDTQKTGSAPSPLEETKSQLPAPPAPAPGPSATRQQAPSPSEQPTSTPEPPLSEALLEKRHPDRAQVYDFLAQRAWEKSGNAASPAEMAVPPTSPLARELSPDPAPVPPTPPVEPAVETAQLPVVAPLAEPSAPPAQEVPAENPVMAPPVLVEPAPVAEAPALIVPPAVEPLATQPPAESIAPAVESAPPVLSTPQAELPAALQAAPAPAEPAALPPTVEAPSPMTAPPPTTENPVPSISTEEPAIDSGALVPPTTASNEIAPPPAEASGAPQAEAPLVQEPPREVTAEEMVQTEPAALAKAVDEPVQATAVAAPASPDLAQQPAAPEHRQDLAAVTQQIAQAGLKLQGMVPGLQVGELYTHTVPDGNGTKEMAVLPVQYGNNDINEQQLMKLVESGDLKFSDADKQAIHATFEELKVLMLQYADTNRPATPLPPAPKPGAFGWLKKIFTREK